MRSESGSRVMPLEHTHKMGRLIGNAVPVRLGEVIAKSLVTHVQAYANSAIPR